MTRRQITVATIGVAGMATGLGVALRLFGGGGDHTAESEQAAPPLVDRVPSTKAPVVPGSTAGIQTARVTTVDGTVYTGRIQWGGNQEAFWDDWFNGVKRDNPWVAMVPPDQLPKARRAISLFGVVLTHRERPFDFERPFLVRFGDIAKIEARGREVRVTLRDGSVVDLDRLNASDFDDGLRVWDAEAGVVDLDSLQVREVELGAPAAIGAVPPRLYGSVSAGERVFTGFLQWDRRLSFADETLEGYDTAGPVQIPFAEISSIARLGIDRVAVARRDGRTVELGGSREAPGSRGVVVEDPRFGRVVVSWEAFQRLELSSAPASVGSGRAYEAFPPGVDVIGSVTTRDGRRIEGRIVFDLDEHRTIETLDAPGGGVDFSIPFAVITWITLPEADAPARVALVSAEELVLERRGDLGEGNAGLLVVSGGREPPQYLAWPDVALVELDHVPEDSQDLPTHPSVVHPGR